ncbi:ATP-binding protein [Phycicoccus endophyticus]|uniref:ATP-binding protein n=1 Tax=Phycicoccus endophyticus TaxID=1690220 RepID=A0A7G9QYM3_9MICO|nr:ATP-binding protein [Phycicoccus endophyticus]NHI19354.1 ATP-binding protein [Phycicoccus endophyticus]QNN48448.1 ATP-binding protein [Phycicoccus endophyticus]
METTLKSHPETDELVRRLRESLREWAQGELAERDDAEITAGLELAVNAVAANGFGLDELVRARFDPGVLAESVVHAAHQSDSEWANSEQARFRIAERGIRMAATSLAKAAAENAPALREVFAVLSQQIASLERRVREVEARDAQPMPGRAAFLAISEQARAELTPDTLPEVDRRDLIQPGLNRLRRDGTPLAIVGDGGLGKSVFAGQIYDALLADGRAVVIVPCSSVPRAASLATAKDVDLALCQAATGLDDVPVFTAALEDLARGGQVCVIIDTLDLILSESSARVIAALLRRIAEQHGLVVLCREREWIDFDLAKSLPPRTVLPLPRLTPDEILAWGEAFVAASTNVSPLFVESLSRAAHATGGSEVLGVPLRLAMACELYGGLGPIPDDLTVAALYRSYWDRRIALDREGLRGEAARAQEEAALAIAGAIWEESHERFVESARPLGAIDWGAVDRLRGEGVLREVAGRFRFFHQTFAEFAVAQYLVAAGQTPDLERLRVRLYENDSGMWGVAAYLLQSELEVSRYDTLAEAVPVDVGTGMRIRLRSALEQPDDDRSIHLVQELAVAAPEELALFADLFLSVGESRRRVAASVLLDLLVNQTGKLNRLAQVAASLLATLDVKARADLLVPAIVALVTRDPALPAVLVSPVVTRLLSGFPTELVEGDLALLVGLYPALPDPGRAHIIARVAAQPESRFQELLEIALRSGLPSGSPDDAGQLLARSWSDPGWRAAQNWKTWRDLLLGEWPQRWDAAQTRAVVKVASHDVGVFEELLREALTPTVTSGRPRVHNAAEFLATYWPTRTAEVILAQGVAADRVAVATASTLMRRVCDEVRADTRQALAEVLWSRRSVDVQTALPALVRLMAGNEPTFVALEGELCERFEEGGPDRARWNCFEAMLQTLTPAQVLAHQPLVALLASGQHATDRINSAVLEGFLAPVSAAARSQCEKIFQWERRTSAVSACARTLHEGLPQWDSRELDADGVPWLVTLLPTRVPKAVEHVAGAIHSRIQTATWNPGMSQRVVDRIVASLRDGEDPQVSKKLRMILMGVLRGPSAKADVTVAHVEQILSAYWDALDADAAAGRSNRSAALWAGLNSTASALALNMYDQEASEELLFRIVHTDSKPLSNRSSRYTAQTVTTYLERDHSRLAHIEGMWASMPQTARIAVAEALDRGLIPGKETTAQRLLNLGAQSEAAARLLSIVETGGSRILR